LVLPYALKDAFNSIAPDVDAVLYTGGAGNEIRDILQKSVEDPEVGNLLCGLYGVPLPGDANKDCKTEVALGTPRSGRGDIFDIFLTGMVLAAPFTINTANGPVTLPAGFNVNRPTNVVPAEMLRINTNIKGALCAPAPSRLGVLGGDACGFPNGRRLTDDIVEIELLAVAGAAYGVLDGRDASFAFNSGLIDVLDDGVYANDRLFRASFPYMALAQSGQEHIHQNPMQKPQVTSTAARVQASSDDAEQKQNGEIFLRSKWLELGQDNKKSTLVGLRFTGLDVPPGARILSAYVRFFAGRSQSGPASLVIRGQATDDAPTFTRDRNNIAQRPLTGQSVNWQNVGAWKFGEVQWSPNLAPLVQEIVGRGGWAQGNDLALVISGTGERAAIAFDGYAKAAPVLYVEYVVGGEPVGAAAESTAVGAAGAVTNIVGSSILLHQQFDAAGLGESSPDSMETDEVQAPDAGQAAERVYLPFTQSQP
jgi:hypothetical protein